MTSDTIVSCTTSRARPGVANAVDASTAVAISIAVFIVVPFRRKTDVYEETCRAGRQTGFSFAAHSQM